MTLRRNLFFRRREGGAAAEVSGMTIIRCIDLESTGIPTEQDRHAVCEVGWCDLTLVGGGDVIIGPTVDMITDPRRPIPPEARAVHHISDAEVAEIGHPVDAAFQLLMQGPPDLFCAHNSGFEREFFGGGDVRWLCSYKVALRLWPDAPSHSLQVLRYHLELDVNHERAMPPHRAGPDAYLCAVMMASILEDGRATIDDMVRWSSGPALLRAGKTCRPITCNGSSTNPTSIET